jgi:hypothetical protein
MCDYSQEDDLPQPGGNLCEINQALNNQDLYDEKADMY